MSKTQLELPQHTMNQEHLPLNEKIQLTDSQMTQMSELSGKDFNAAIMKMLQHAMTTHA